MSHASTLRHPARKAKAAHLGIPFPETPHDYDTSKGRYWIAAYFRYAARETAIEGLIKQKTRRDGITTDALHLAAVLIQERASKALSLALEEGFLLFAWTGTRFFQENAEHP